MTAAPPEDPEGPVLKDPVLSAARRAALRAKAGMDDPEPSLGTRLGQIGVLGWMVVGPILVGVFLGRWLDRACGTGVFFSAPAILVGAGVGFWCAWKWMHHR